MVNYTMHRSINDSKTIYTDSGIPIPWLEKDVDNYLDKTTLIFGGSGSGKTTIIEEILYLCKSYIPNYIVIVPKTSDKVYRKKLPARCIKDDITKKQLQKIWDRQFNFAQLYNVANDPANLESLFNKIYDRPSIVMVKAITQRANDLISNIENNHALDFGQKNSQKSAIEDLRNKKLKTLYKKTIRNFRPIIITISFQ